MYSIQAALHVSKPKIPNEPIGYSITNNRAQWALGRHFYSVTKFKSSDAQIARLIATNTLETNECLLQEDADRTIGICREVGTAKAQLPLWQRCDSVGWQTDQ